MGDWTTERDPSIRRLNEADLLSRRSRVDWRFFRRLVEPSFSLVATTVHLAEQSLSANALKSPFEVSQDIHSLEDERFEIYNGHCE